MFRTAMFREPLERYLASKILIDGRIKVDAVHIRRVDTSDPSGCNWDLDRVEPALSDREMNGAVRSVLRQLRASLYVQDWSGEKEPDPN